MQHDYLKAKDLHEITGLSEKYFTLLAANNKIDWAIQPGGPNTKWLFRREGFENWLSKGAKPKWPTSTNGKTRSTSGGASSTRTKRYADPLKQILDDWQPKG